MTENLMRPKAPPSRKIKAFLWMVVSILACVVVTTKVQAPVEVASNALWIIGFGGLCTIGGQSLIDTVGKYVEGKKQ